MSDTVKFTSYRYGPLSLSLSSVSKAMYKEALAPNSYDYRDPKNGLSFQLISRIHIFICDPAYQIVQTILDAKWQIIYSSAFTAGIENVMFVAKDADPTATSNQKSISDVLQFYNYSETLPIKTLGQAYMKVVALDNSTYIVGTLFTPSQPYVNLTLSSTTLNLASGVESRLLFDTLSGSVDTLASDAGAIVPIITGSDTGRVQLAVPGRYLVEASFELDKTTGTITGSTLAYIAVRLNGVTVSRNFGPVINVGSGVDGAVSIVALIRVSKSDLKDATYANKAILDVTGFHSTGISLVVGNSAFTNFSVNFLG